MTRILGQMQASQMFKRKAAVVAVALVVAGISACSDSSKDAKKSATASPPMTEEQRKYQEVFNPTPEQLAKRKAESAKADEANKPAVVQFANPGLSDDLSKYITINEGFVPLNIYTAQKNWSEDDEDVAKSLSLSERYEGTDKKAAEAYQKWSRASDVFEKQDAAKELVGRVSDLATQYKDTHLVKFVIKGDTFVDGMPAYDLKNKRYDFNIGLFSDKSEYTAQDRKRISSGSPIEPVKGFTFITPLTDYMVGFSSGAPLRYFSIEEEQARKAEKARAKNELSLVVYGYVGSVQRNRSQGELKSERYVLLTAQRADLVDEKTHEVYGTSLIQ